MTTRKKKLLNSSSKIKVCIIQKSPDRKYVTDVISYQLNERKGKI